MTTNLKVGGMMCEACSSHVTRALQGVSGVRSAEVDLQNGSARIEHDGANEQELTAAVSEAGYEAQVVD